MLKANKLNDLYFVPVKQHSDGGKKFWYQTTHLAPTSRYKYYWEIENKIMDRSIIGR